MEYTEFTRLKGRSLKEMNPGSDSFALSIEDALTSLSIIENSRIAILGGDVLSETDDGKLIYAYQIWGSKYHCLNWYCDSIQGEARDTYLSRSYSIARKAINEAKTVAENLGKKVFVVYVAK